jgi:outer membrane protein assembly factor BamB
MRTTPSTALVALLLTGFAASASWPQFRGPNASGVASGKPPIAFGAESNVIWKTAVPSGLSSPCVAAGKVFVTAYEDGKLLALAFDQRTGKELWRREAPAGNLRLEDIHKVSSPAVATPVSNGERVVVYFLSFGLVGYDMDGKERWRKPVPKGLVINGSGTSPAIHGETVLLALDQDEGDSLLLAVDANSGDTRWETRRDVLTSSYTTPVVWKHNGREDVVVSGSIRVAGYDLKTGNEQWQARVTTSVAVTPTPAVGDDLLFVMSRGVPPNAMGTFASFAERSDKDGDGKVTRSEAGELGSAFRALDRDRNGFITEGDWNSMTNLFGKGDSGLFALRSGPKGDVTSSHVAWKQTRGIAGIASPLFYKGRLYVVQDGGRVSCWEGKTGKVLYEQERLGADGEYYGSPVAANGHVYFTSNRGVVSVIRAGDKLDVVARNSVGEPVMTTPALVNDQVYIRSAKHLWAFGKK